ncbi:MAG: hypothetical protein AAGA77_17655 [Bacteroidota bacterium]
MKRIFVLLLFSFTFIMCKSTSKLPTEELLSFVVILEKDVTPKDLKKDISYRQVNYEESDKNENQWIVNYSEEIDKEKQIKTALLNHPGVLSVFTKAQYAQIKDKSSKDTRSGNQGKKTPVRQ